MKKIQCTGVVLLLCLMLGNTQFNAIHLNGSRKNFFELASSCAQFTLFKLGRAAVAARVLRGQQETTSGFRRDV